MGIANYIINKVLSVQLTGSNDITPFGEKDLSFYIPKHSNLTTVASTVYNSSNTTMLPEDVSRAYRTRVFLQSTNQGALVVLYSYDGTNYIANTVTGTLDSGKYVYEWSKDAPIATVKYTYTETASPGNISGGISTVERVIV